LVRYVIRVQIFASSKKIPFEFEENFKGLNTLSKELTVFYIVYMLTVIRFLIFKGTLVERANADGKWGTTTSYIVALKMG